MDSQRYSVSPACLTCSGVAFIKYPWNAIHTLEFLQVWTIPPRPCQCWISSAFLLFGFCRQTYTSCSGSGLLAGTRKYFQLGGLYIFFGETSGRVKVRLLDVSSALAIVQLRGPLYMSHTPALHACRRSRGSRRIRFEQMFIYVSLLTFSFVMLAKANCCATRSVTAC